MSLFRRHTGKYHVTKAEAQPPPPPIRPPFQPKKQMPTPENKVTKVAPPPPSPIELPFQTGEMVTKMKFKTQHDLLISELKRVQKSKNRSSSSPEYERQKFCKPKPNILKPKLEYLKSRASEMEKQIIMDLKMLQKLHYEEIVLLKEQFKNKDAVFQRELRFYFDQQKTYIQGVVQKYVISMLQLDPNATKETEKMLKKMVDDLGVEVEKEVWGNQGKKKSMWGKFRNGVRKALGLSP